MQYSHYSEVKMWNSCAKIQISELLIRHCNLAFSHQVCEPKKSAFSMMKCLRNFMNQSVQIKQVNIETLRGGHFLGLST